MNNQKLECDVCVIIPKSMEFQCTICGVFFCSKKCQEIHKKNFDVVLDKSKGWAEKN